MFLFVPLENKEDKFNENINIMIQDLGNLKINLQQYKDISDKQISEIATNPEILESKIIKAKESEYYKIVYNMTQGTFRLKISSCFIKNDKAYLATFTGELHKYDVYQEVGEEILNSLSLR